MQIGIIIIHFTEPIPPWFNYPDTAIQVEPKMYIYNFLYPIYL